MKVYAIFDIGKTNKKFILFDNDFNIVFEKSQVFPETKDEEGFNCDDLDKIKQWINLRLRSVIEEGVFTITHINFSTYGATLVHLDEDNKVLTAMHNYLKPMDEELFKGFMSKYGPQDDFEACTGSPSAGFLNAGFQLYWLKFSKPEIFNQLKMTLNFPQYLAYSLTGKAYADYTSIGCHTSLWDYKNDEYHRWVSKERLQEKILPVVSPAHCDETILHSTSVKVGVGIHDSSAALLPYIKCIEKPFLLVSTGTWSITLNPFYDKKLTTEDIRKDCLNYMSSDGLAVRASRLFLGQEYKEQVEKLIVYFKKENSYDQKIKFDKNIYLELKNKNEKYFSFNYLLNEQQSIKSLQDFNNFEIAYHQLMIELCDQQIKAIELAKGDSEISDIYIDGGFMDNDVFVKIIATIKSNFNIFTASSSLGSALGAALVLTDVVPKNFMIEKYNLKQVNLS
jgi:L-fuculokinase